MTPNDIRLYLGRSKYIKNLPFLRPSASAIPLRWWEYSGGEMDSGLPVAHYDFKP